MGGGVTVTLRNTETGLVRTATTNERGIFVATLLPVGTYDVTARSPGATEARRQGVTLRLGETVELALALGAIQVQAIEVTTERPLVDPARIEAAVSFTPEVVSNLPNNGRNYLNLVQLTPNVAIVQGPDGDEISVGGQRGIYNNIMVDGADFNNPFFGEQRGGQRPAFTFNLDAVQEMVVISQGANAEFGRSAGGFVNVLTKSGTNEFHGSVHYYGQADAISANEFCRGATCSVPVSQRTPDFSQHQFGFTLGGPIRRDRAFFFIAYDHQLADQTKQRFPLRIPNDSMRIWLDTAFGGALAEDYGPISRTNDARALLLKLDWRLSPMHNLSLKYNYTWAEQVNGTFDVDTWMRSANAVERDNSHAINGALVSLLSPSMTNEFRFQYSREPRPRPYDGPTIPGSGGRPFPDTGVDFANGYRFGMPFFIPIEATDNRIQLLNNISLVRGNHLFKAGVEWNRTEMVQTFIGFANGRFIFSSVEGFYNYLIQGPTYVECLDGSAAGVGATCGAPFNNNWGPLLFYLQFAPVPPLTTPEQAGTQSLVQHDLALFIQDTWKPRRNLTVNYGLRWEAQVQPDPITPPDRCFYCPFIGQTRTGNAGAVEFPGDGTIPADYGMWQPRLGIAWDIDGDGRQVVRASAGIYAARTASLNFASTRSTNGSVGQTIFRSSDFNAFAGGNPFLTPPAYPNLITVPANTYPDHPDLFLTSKDFQNPRTYSFNAGYERQLTRELAAGISYTYSATNNLSRFVNRNDPALGNGTTGPWATGLPAIPNQSAGPGDTLNGISSFTTNASGLTVLESTAKSRYHGFTLTLRGTLARRLQFQANYTLSFDKSDDDNERDPFSYRYARVTELDKEYNWSDRDQRHRVNTWFQVLAPWGILLNSRVSYNSAQPTSESCGTNNQGTGQPADTPGRRICPNGTVLRRNTIRKDNASFQWDVRISRPFPVGRGNIEAIVEVFNLTNTFNIENPSAPSLLFNFDGTIRSGLGDARRMQMGVRWTF
jgi:hypothetical protein